MSSTTSTSQEHTSGPLSGAPASLTNINPVTTAVPPVHTEPITTSLSPVHTEPITTSLSPVHTEPITTAVPPVHTESPTRKQYTALIPMKPITTAVPPVHTVSPTGKQYMALIPMKQITTTVPEVQSGSSDATYDALPLVICSGLLFLIVLLILGFMVLPYIFGKRGRYHTHEANETEAPKHELFDSSDEDL